jgi:hypothetical protein
VPVCRRAVRSRNLASRPRSLSPSKWLGPFQLGGNWGNQEVKRGENYDILGKTWQDLGIRGTFETIRLGRSLYKKLGLEKVTWGDSEQQIHQCVTMGMISEAISNYFPIYFPIYFPTYFPIYSPIYFPIYFPSWFFELFV